MPQSDFRLEILNRILHAIKSIFFSYRYSDNKEGLYSELKSEDFAHTTAVNLYLSLFMRFDLEENNIINRAAFIQCCIAAVETMVDFIETNLNSEDDLSSFNLLDHSTLILHNTLAILVSDGIFPNDDVGAEGAGEIERWTKDDPTVIRTGECKRFKRDYLTSYASVFYRNSYDLLRKTFLFTAHLYAFKSKVAGRLIPLNDNDIFVIHRFLAESKSTELEEVNLEFFKAKYILKIMDFFNTTAHFYFASKAEYTDVSYYCFEDQLNSLINVSREYSSSLYFKEKPANLVTPLEKPKPRW